MVQEAAIFKYLMSSIKIIHNLSRKKIEGQTFRTDLNLKDFNLEFYLNNTENSVLTSQKTFRVYYKKKPTSQRSSKK